MTAEGMLLKAQEQHFRTGGCHQRNVTVMMLFCRNLDESSPRSTSISMTKSSTQRVHPLTLSHLTYPFLALSISILSFDLELNTYLWAKLLLPHHIPKEGYVAMQLEFRSPCHLHHQSPCQSMPLEQATPQRRLSALHYSSHFTFLSPEGRRNTPLKKLHHICHSWS